jgi:type IV pilus assembly protein PilA
MRRSIRRKTHGLTLVELLVVVLILGVLLAVAIPLYLQSVARSATNTCQTNLKTIANVAMGFRTDDASHLFPTTAELDTHLQAEGQPTLANLLGPNGESYTYTQTGSGSGFTIACDGNPTVHGSFDSATGQITGGP